ncbi:hypothetical protein [Xanthobacter sp. KR7-225]|uniref:hypothetical protein n=1 Tax=Xanthobacter sp. KR7-225 TaxID=3156613 RepID=UPI0032B50905
MKSAILGLVAVALAAAAPAATRAAELPDYLKPISGPPRSPSAADIATRDVLQLNVSMFSLYENAGQVFRKNILDQHPMILALFSGAGGRMILYRPGKPTLDAAPVPRSYQVMKSLGHSAMAVSEVVLPYVDNPGDTSWIAPMRAYLTEMKSALGGIAAAEMPDAWRPNSRAILENNIAFMEECLSKGVITLASVQAFGKTQAPVLRKAVAWAAETQVNHWMAVLDQWKTELGGSFDSVYGASNTIYVARQNNVLFSVLAQYFGPKAINERLFLIETVSFTTTPDDILTAAVRIISDRSVGGLFFNNYRLMDYELMGGDARKAIIAGMKARGQEPVLPPAVPFGSGQWPALISGGSGPASLDDLL